MAGKRKNNEAYVEDWCLEHDCDPEDLDLDVAKAHVITTRLARQYRPQYLVRFTEQFDEWYWRKIITKIKDLNADPEKYIWSQVRRNKSRFNPSNLLNEVATSEYHTYLERKMEEETGVLVDTLVYVLTTGARIPIDELFSNRMSTYTELLKYTAYVFSYLSVEDPVKEAKYRGLSEGLKVEAGEQYHYDQTKEIYSRALRRFNGIGLQVKEILDNSLGEKSLRN